MAKDLNPLVLESQSHQARKYHCSALAYQLPAHWAYNQECRSQWLHLASFVVPLLSGSLPVWQPQNQPKLIYYLTYVEWYCLVSHRDELPHSDAQKLRLIKSVWAGQLLGFLSILYQLVVQRWVFDHRWTLALSKILDLAQSLLVVVGSGDFLPVSLKPLPHYETSALQFLRN